MLTMLGAVAEFERDLMLEQQREGIAKAKADGKYRGRAPTVRARTADVLRLRKMGVKKAIADQLSISEASVFASSPKAVRMARCDTTLTGG